MKLILKIYDYFKGHGRVLWLSLALVIVILGGLVTRLKFSENISDFMPLEKSESQGKRHLRCIRTFPVQVACIFFSTIRMTRT